MTKLAKPIDLNGKWEVRLAEIQYLRMWDTLQEEDTLFYVTGGVSIPAVLQYNLKVGHYRDIENLISEMNAALGMSKLKLDYGVIKNKVYMVGPPHMALKAKGNLARLLGFVPDVFQKIGDRPLAPNPADICVGFYTIYVNSDIVEHQRVGDSLHINSAAQNILKT